LGESAVEVGVAGNVLGGTAQAGAPFAWDGQWRKVVLQGQALVLVGEAVVAVKVVTVPRF
jgi:hypothetical protein